MFKFIRRFEYVLRRRRIEAELLEEMEFHRVQTQQRLEQSGMASRAAHCESRRALGNVTLAREDARAVWIRPWLESIWQDLWYAVRSLRAQAGFALTAIVTLGVGIGLNTSVATMFTALFWQPWAVPNPGEVVQIMKRETGHINYEFGYRQYRNLAENARLTAVVATSCGVSSREGDCGVKIDGEPFNAQFVSGNYFHVLAIAMDRGRGFVDDEDRPGAPVPVVVISHRLWERRFASDPGVIGKTILVDDEPFTVVGVARRGFNGAWLIGRDLWLPLASHEILRPTDRGMTWVDVAGRVRPGISRQQAQAELESLFPYVDREKRRIGILLVGTSSISRAGNREGGFIFFRTLFLGVLLVLLLSCANAGNLLLARTLARGREIAVRTSLGASRLRVIRQLLTESLLIAVAAAGVGIWLAFLLPSLALDSLLYFAGTAGHLAYEVTPDIWVLAFTLAMVIVTCLGFGLAPAIHASRARFTDLSVRTSQAGGRFPLRSFLLSVQVAVSIVLLVAAGLLVRGIQHGRTVDLGFAVDGVTVVSFELPAPYDLAKARAFSDRLLPEILALPGSEAFGITTATPFGDNYRGRVRVGGHDNGQPSVVGMVAVSPGYFEALKLPIVAGRRLDAGDERSDGVLVNQVFADQYWPGQNPIGRTIVSGWDERRLATRHVVGVVGPDDTEALTLRLLRPRPRIYEPVSGPRRLTEIHEGDDVRHVPEVLLPSAAAGASPVIAAIAARLDPRVQVRTVPLSANRDAWFSQVRVLAALAGVLGITALVLAAVGVFGVFAYSVRQKSAEIGIRIALGAQSRQVVAGVLSFGSRPLAIGVLVGLGSAMAAAQLLRSVLHGLSAFDPVSYLAVVGILGISAALAVSVPAWRASRVDPIVALRCE